MFTGIVDHQGKIQSIQAIDQGLQFVIETQFETLCEGESIMVDGACLTVVSSAPSQFVVQLSAETCAKTIANTYQVGSLVNLERAMCASDRFGGHYVTGHVEQVARVAELKPVGGCLELRFSGILQKQLRYLMDKGSVCINGVSLTVNHVLSDGFAVMLIPHTLEITNLKTLHKNSPVNIEFDWMVKVIVNQMLSRGVSICNV